MTARQHATFMRTPLPPTDRDLIARLAASLTEPQHNTKDRAPLVADEKQAWEHATVMASLVRAAGWTPPLPRG